MNDFEPVGVPDFRDINIQEELAASELDRLVSPVELVDRLEARRNSMLEGIELPFAQLKDTDFRLHRGTLNLIGGYTGHFKSTIASQIGLRALRKGHNVGIASLELFAEDVLEHYVEIGYTQQEPPMDYVKTFSEWAKGKLHIYDRMDSIEPEEAIQMVIAFAKHCNCELIVLDALMMINDVCGDSAVERSFTQTLAAVAKKFEIAIVLVHHVRKPSGFEGEEKIPGKYDFIGSSHLANIAASLMIVWHDKVQNELRTQDELRRKKSETFQPNPDYNPAKADMIFKVAKSRYGRYEGSIALWRHDKCRGFTSDEHRALTQFNVAQMGVTLKEVI
tara:strand:- start:235 stop:1236 length:1002 start_codon:yes stop_codon:yes gene_type:complete